MHDRSGYSRGAESLLVAEENNGVNTRSEMAVWACCQEQGKRTRFADWGA
jgi:hypothetical protein